MRSMAFLLPVLCVPHSALHWSQWIQQWYHKCSSSLYKGVQISPKDPRKCSPVHHNREVITFILRVSNQTCFSSMIRQELVVFWEYCFSCLFSAAAQSGKRGDSQSKHMSNLSGVYRLKMILSVWNKEVVIAGLHGGNATVNKESAPPLRNQ